MKAFHKYLAGAAAAAALTVGAAAPASAQYYPGYGGYGGGGLGDVLVGAVLNSILRGGSPSGYNGYYGARNFNYERAAVDQCARVTEQRLNRNSNSAYGYAPAAIRVVQIDRVQRLRNGDMRVYGQATNTAYQGNYGQYGGYNQPYGGGYGGYNQPHGGYNQPYGGYNQPYGGYNQPYGGYQQQAGAEFRFNCRFSRNGRITDLDIDRNRTAYRY